MRTVNWWSGVVSASLSASLVSLGLLPAQPQIEAELLQQIARAAGVAGRAAADADHVVALRIEIEERIEGGRAVNRGRRNAGLLGDVAQRLHREILVGVGRLHRLQDSQQRAGPVRLLCNRLVDQQPFVSIQLFIATLCMIPPLLNRILRR